jgi:hypothetical protein
MFALGALEKVSLIPEASHNGGEQLKSLGLTARALGETAVGWCLRVCNVVYTPINVIQVPT